MTVTMLRTTQRTMEFLVALACFTTFGKTVAQTEPNAAIVDLDYVSHQGIFEVSISLRPTEM